MKTPEGKNDDTAVPATTVGIPLVRRETPPRACELPTIERKRPTPTVRVQQADSGMGYRVGLEAYDEILSLLAIMGRATEQSPQTYETWDGEDFRNLFLVVLNAMYHGSTTGEAFGNVGSTDIMVTAGANVLFVAECRIWNGASEFRNAIDQLLGYCTWTDTSTALVVFDRGPRHPATLRTIENALQGHRSYVRRLPFRDELGTRWAVRHPLDDERETVLTSMAFHVPARNPEPS